MKWDFFQQPTKIRFLIDTPVLLSSVLIQKVTGSRKTYKFIPSGTSPLQGINYPRFVYAPLKCSQGVLWHQCSDVPASAVLGRHSGEPISDRMCSKQSFQKANLWANKHKGLEGKGKKSRGLTWISKSTKLSWSITPSWKKLNHFRFKMLSCYTMSCLPD